MDFGCWSAVPSASAATASATRRTATIWAGIWLVGIAITLALQWNTLLSPAVSGIAIGILIAAWLVLVLLGRGRVELFIAVAAATALVQIANTQPAALADTYVAALPWLDLSAMMAGFLLGRSAPRVIVAIAAGAFLILIGAAIAAGAMATVWRECVLFPAHTLANGLAIAAGIWALCRISEADDEAVANRAAAQSAEQAARAHRDEVFSISRTLHDTVINTFSAIQSGVASDANSRVAARCAADLEILEWAAAGTSGRCLPVGATPYHRLAETVTESARRRSELLGLRLSVSVTPYAASDETLGCAPMSDRVLDAICGAIDEALTNTAKHSGAQSAELRVTETAAGFEVEIVDRGRGFLGSYPRRGGVVGSIRDRAHRVGVAARISSAPGRGTRVVLSWTPTADAIPAQASPAASSATELLVAAATWAAVLLIGLAGLAVVVASRGDGTVATAAGVVILLLASTVAISSARRSATVAWPASALLVAAAGATTLLAGFGSDGPHRFGTVWWGSDAGVLPLVLLALLSRRWVWVAAGSLAHLGVAAALIVDAGSVSATCQRQLIAVVAVNVAVVVGATVFRRTLVRLGDAVDAARVDWQAAANRAAVIREQERARDARARRVLETSGPLLRDIANDELQPQDSAVRQRCAREEVYLRSIIHVDPELDGLGDLLLGAVDAAHRRGKTINIRGTEPIPLPTPETVAAVAGLLTRIIDSVASGTELIVTLFAGEGGTATMSIVWHGLVRDEDGLRREGAAAGGDLTVSVHVMGSQYWVEIGWIGVDSNGDVSELAVSAT